MNHVRVISTTGQEVEISHDELMKLIHSHHLAHGRETNTHYKHRAFQNICEEAKHYGIKDVENSEEDIKELLGFSISHNDPELLGEIIEWFIADHTEKTGA